MNYEACYGCMPHATPCQAPNFWSTRYESFGAHEYTRLASRRGGGGAERSGDAATTEPPKARRGHVVQ